MALPRVEMVGNLVADPELRFTPTGMAVCKFRLACSERKRQADGTWADGDTSFLDVVVFADRGEAAAESMTKGTKAIVIGRLRGRSYETNQGERRTAWEVVADEAVAVPNPKTTRSTGGGDDPWATNWNAPAQGAEPPF
jgi:single-strand DNA-binding protein